jgi:hypothetical protein
MLVSFLDTAKQHNASCAFAKISSVLMLLTADRVDPVSGWLMEQPQTSRINSAV